MSVKLMVLNGMSCLISLIFIRQEVVTNFFEDRNLKDYYIQVVRRKLQRSLVLPTMKAEQHRVGFEGAPYYLPPTALLNFAAFLCSLHLSTLLVLLDDVCCLTNQQVVHDRPSRGDDLKI